MASIDAYQSEPFMKGWAPADDPAEIVGDLLNEVAEQSARISALESELERAKGLMCEAADTINELDPDKAGEMLISHRLRAAAGEPTALTQEAKPHDR